MKKRASLLVTSLAGCGSGSGGNTTTAAATTAAATTAAATTAATTAAAQADSEKETTAAAETPTEALPNVPALKGPGNVTLKLLRQNTSLDLNERPEAKVIEEVTGYDTEYSSLNKENATESLLLQVSSGTDIDMVSMTVAQFQILMKNGALAPLNDLLKVYGQDILSGVSDESWRVVTAEDGTIYGTPVRYPYPGNMTRFIVCRLDMMEEAGITELPKTLDEFYNALVTLKNFYNCDYVLTGPAPAAATGGQNGLGLFTIPPAIASAFGIYSSWMVDDSGKVIYITEADQFKEMLAFMRKLMEEGLLDPDWATNTSTTLGEKFSSGQAIMMCSEPGKLSEAITALPENNPNVVWNGSEDDDIGYIYALAGADGTRCYAKVDTIQTVTGVLRSSDNAADCINFLNEKIKNQEYIMIGTEGVTFEIDENGLPVPIQPAFDENKLRGDKFQDCMNEEEYAWEWQARARKNLNNWLPLRAAQAEIAADPDLLVDDYFSLMPAYEKYTDYNDTLFDGLNDFCEQVIYGNKTVDNLDEYVAEWNLNEGEAVRAELQRFYDEIVK